jgi:hypothetical protein
VVTIGAEEGRNYGEKVNTEVLVEEERSAGTMKWLTVLRHFALGNQGKIVDVERQVVYVY